MKILQNEITGIFRLVFPAIFGGKLSFILSFLFYLSTTSAAATYIFIFTAPTCTTIIISLEPCALNAAFQQFNTEI
jgi:hypothetical protein